MDKNKQYFISLLSCYLNKTAPEYTDGADWKEIYRLASMHSLCEVTAYMAGMLPKEKLGSERLCSVFRQTLGYAVIQSEKTEAAHRRINSFLNAAGEEHIFVKGIVLRELYPVKELRTSGDIDVIVRENALERIYNALKAEKDITIDNYKTDVLIVSIDGMQVEIHGNADVLSDYFDDIFSLCTKADGCLFELDAYNHLLYVICHIAKHLAYRGAGIKMLMDIDVLVRSIENFDEQVLLELAEKANTGKTCEALLSLCAYYFDTPVKPFIDFGSQTELLEMFNEALLDGGVFGYKASTIPMRYVNTDKEKMSFFDKLGVLFKMAFPDRAYLKKCYPYYNKNSFLYPAARLNRLLDCFKKLKKAKNASRQIFTQSDSFKTQARLMQELDIK